MVWIIQYFSNNSVSELKEGTSCSFSPSSSITYIYIHLYIYIYKNYSKTITLSSLYLKVILCIHVVILQNKTLKSTYYSPRYMYL